MLCLCAHGTTRLFGVSSGRRVNHVPESPGSQRQEPRFGVISSPQSLQKARQYPDTAIVKNVPLFRRHHNYFDPSALVRLTSASPLGPARDGSVESWPIRASIVYISSHKNRLSLGYHHNTPTNIISPHPARNRIFHRKSASPIFLNSNLWF